MKLYHKKWNDIGYDYVQSVFDMSPKTRKSTTGWMKCERCDSYILQKDVEHHNDCPPESPYQYNFIDINQALHSELDLKSNEDIKALTQHDKDNLVFLSQSVIQLCSLSIGNWVHITSSNLTPVAKRVWPTTEKTVTSVLLTKHAMELACMKPNLQVTIQNVTEQVREAKEITLVILNAPKILDLSLELKTRIHKLHLDFLLMVGNIISILFYGKLLKFEIKAIELNRNCDNLIEGFENLSFCNESYFCKVVEKTIWQLYKDEIEYKREMLAVDLFAKIGGLHDEMSEINDLISSALGTRKKTLKFKTCKGVLLYGNSGTGKTLLANALGRSAGVHFVNVCAADLYVKYSGNSADEALKEILEEALRNRPMVVLFDEVDVLCPLRSNRTSDVEKRMVANILAFFEELKVNSYNVFVLGTTNKLENVDPAFRKCDRFDREIEIPTPNPTDRFNILTKLMSDVENNLQEGMLKEIANTTHGFVGADLALLCSRATQQASKCGKMEVEFDDFKFALTRVRPSAMREVQIEVPDVKWSDIGGQESLKLILRQAVEWPLKHSDSFVRMGITPPRGVLMFGPPGCSKTMIAKALATESGLNFISIKGPELFSKWVGESERAVREVFRKARQVAPSIVFFDEIDALGGERTSGSASNSVQERVLAQLLTELDGVTPLGDVTIVAATNRPDRIDKALLRPGRLDRIVYVPLPDSGTRREIFKLKLGKMPVVDVNVEELVKLTENYSGAEVNAVCHEAAMAALEENLDATHVKMIHFKKALLLIQARTPSSLIKVYEEYVNR